MAVQYAEYRDGKLFFSGDTDFNLLYDSACALCVNRVGELPACIPPDQKSKVIEVGLTFNEEQAQCLAHEIPNPECVIERNLLECLTADQA